MDVLKVRHVLADDEQVILALVHGFELENRLARARMEDAEPPSRRHTGLDDGRFGSQFEPVVAHVERRAAHERHAAARAHARDIERVVRMHRAHERSGVCVGGVGWRERLLGVDE